MSGRIIHSDTISLVAYRIANDELMPLITDECPPPRYKEILRQRLLYQTTVLGEALAHAHTHCIVVAFKGWLDLNSIAESIIDAVPGVTNAKSSDGTDAMLVIGCPTEGAMMHAILWLSGKGISQAG